MPMKQTLSILHLECDALTRSAFRKFIAANLLPFEVHTACTVGDARRMIMERDVDVVLSERTLEDGTVFDLLEGGPISDVEGIHAPPLTLPLILATDCGDELTAVRAMRGGASDYIIKDPDHRWMALIPQVAESAVRQHQTQSRYRMLTHALMSITDAVFITNTAQHIIFVNKAFCQIYGFKEDEILGQSASLLRAPAPPVEATAETDSRGAIREIYHRRKDGRIFPVSLTRSIIHDEKGLNMAIVGVARDISAWKEAEARLTNSLKEKEVLLKEIHHRVKNNLQVVSSLLNLQSGYVKDEQTIDALRDSQNRVKSMALIHERLYQSESLNKIDFGGYVQSLVNHVKSSFRGMGEIDVEVDVPDIFVDVDVAIPCGLIINELASNSFKHAFSPKNGASSGGRVHIRLSQHQDVTGHKELQLMVGDNGNGYPQDLDIDHVASLGLQLVNSLVQQLKGTIQLENQGGAQSRVCIPLAQSSVIN
ncbi:histidine kinase dimerization/phosphoacceptor domain -containing protein [Megalodesulfovibrio paquesii]